MNVSKLNINITNAIFITTLSVGCVFVFFAKTFASKFLSKSVKW